MRASMQLQQMLLMVGCMFLAAVSSVDAAYCQSHPDPHASPNTFPITTPSPSFVRSVPNGALYELLIHDQLIPLVHLWGTPYEKGLAQGKLMGDKLNGFLTDVIGYLVSQGAAPLNASGIPLQQAEAIVQLALDVGLDVTSYETQPFTGEWYQQELQGISDGSGIPVDTIRRVQMLGELTKGSCSMFGAWDEALDGGEGLLTMRALDWISDGPFQNYHQLTVYHAATSPNGTSGERTFLTLGWTGWIGTITGVNDAQLSIHEIGVSFPDKSFGNESSQGVPFTYVLRDILQFDSTRLDGLSRLASAHRTCDLILGVGDGKDRRMNSVQYSADVCGIMDDNNMRPVADWHPRLNHTVYHAMDWLCPTFNSVMHSQLNSLWGSLTPAVAISDILPIVQTGNLHIYVADLANMMLYVSFMANDNSTATQRNAFDRQFAILDLWQIFATVQKEEKVVEQE